MINKKLILAVCMFSLILILPMTSAGWFDWLFGGGDDVKILTNDSRISIDGNKVLMKMSTGNFTVKCRSSPTGDNNFNRDVNSYVVDRIGDTWKYGAYSNLTGWQKHQCIIKSRNPIELIDNSYYIRDGNGGFKYDDSDICPVVNPNTNETVKCKYRLETIMKQVYDSESDSNIQVIDYYQFGTVFWSEQFIDPSWTYENLEITSSLNNLTIEPDNSTHLTVNDSNIVLYIPFDTNLSNITVYDYSDNDNDVNIIGNAHYTDNGFIGGAFEFDGNLDYLRNSVTFFPSINSPRSVCAWINTTDFSPQAFTGRIVSERFSQGWLFRVGNNGIISFLATGTGTSMSIISDNGVISLNTWEHVCFSHEGGTTATGTRLYVNGVEVTYATQQDGTSIVNSNGDFTIGKEANEESSTEFEGIIDELIVWNTNLSDAEILAVYQNSSSRFFNSGVQVFKDQNVTLGVDNKINWTMTGQSLLGSNFTGRIGGWKEDDAYLPDTNNILYFGFNNNSLFGENGSLVFDYSGNGNNGTIFGATFIEEGQYAGAYDFDEVNDKIITPDFSYGSADQYISMWFKIDDNTGSFFQYFYSHGTVGTANSINLFINEASQASPNIITSNIQYASGGGTSAVVNIASLIGDGIWHHYAVNLNDSGSFVFIDGVFAASGDPGTGGFNPATDLYLGGRNDNNTDRYYGGGLDELNIWNISFSPEEVKSDYIQGKLINRTYTDSQDIVSGDNIFDVNSDETNFIAELTYNPSNNSFYTPILESGIQLDSFSGEADNEFPIFTNVDDNNGTLIDSGTVIINSTITSTNGTAGVEFDGVNFTASNVSDLFNVSFSKSPGGDYTYFFWAYGNGTDNNFNTSQIFDYTINSSAVDNEFPIFTNIGFNITNGTEYFGGTYLANSTITSTNGTAGIEFDGVNFTATNISDLFSSDLNKLAVGDYNYFWWAYGNGTDTNFNNTETFVYSVVINSSLVLGISGTTPIEYETTTDVSGSSCPTELTCNLDKSNIVYEAGVETFNFSTVGNENYSASSITIDITINQNNSYVLDLTASTPITYGTTTDFASSGCPSQITCVLNISNAVYEAGTISANFSTAGNNNYSANSTTFTVIINKAIPEGSISGTTPIDFGTAGDVQGSESNAGDFDVTYELFRENILVSNPDTSTLGAGSYDYIFNATAGTNYTDNASMDTFTLVVNKIASQTNLTFDLVSPQDYLTAITPICSVITGEGTPILTLDGSVVSSGSPLTLGANTYNFTCTLDSTQNYTSSFNQSDFTIDQISSSVFTYLNHSRSNITINDGDSIYLNGTRETGEGIIKLYNDGNLINSGTSPLSNLTTFSSVGVFNITTIYEATQNYTQNFETWWVNVTGTIDSIFPIFYNISDNNFELIDSGTVTISTNINSTNGTAWVQFDGTNYTMVNLTDNFFNVSFVISTSGTFNYFIGSYGNGTDNNINTTETFSYTINSSITISYIFSVYNNTKSDVNRLFGVLKNGLIEIKNNLNIGGNLNVDNNISLSNNVAIYKNDTCFFYPSPDGSFIMEVCDT